MSASFFKPQSQPQPICIYEGIPRKPNANSERGRWRRFIDWITPSFVRTRELGDEYLEAHVLQKRADAIKTLSEAGVNYAKARKLAAQTAEIASRLEQERQCSAVNVGDDLGPDQLRAEIEAEQALLENKIRLARLKYGTRVLQLPAETAMAGDDEPTISRKESRGDHDG